MRDRKDIEDGLWVPGLGADKALNANLRFAVEVLLDIRDLLQEQKDRSKAWEDKLHLDRLSQEKPQTLEALNDEHINNP